MPYAGLGLHFLIAVFFAVHVVRSGQNMYWLLILFSFPLLGSLVYFVAVYLPNSRLEHGARKVARATAKALDPGRELREAQAAFDYTPTAQNQIRLAAALLEAGQAEAAANAYEACLTGPFASDCEIRLGAARAQFACGRFVDAISHLEEIRKEKADFRAESVALLLARALAAAGRHAEARGEFKSAMERFGSFETRAEYLIWAIDTGDRELVARLSAEIDREVARWNRHTRDLNRPLLRRLETARAGLASRPA